MKIKPNLQTTLVTIAFFAMLMIPNSILARTEPYSAWSEAVLILLPLGFYMLWSILLRRSGIMIWLAFPIIFFAAFQIVLLYIFGNAIIATDMFINLFTTNPEEAGELLGNIYPAVLIVFVIYLPILWFAAVDIYHKRIIPTRLRKLVAGVGGVVFATGLLLLIPAYWFNEDKNVLKTEIFPLNVFYNLKLSLSEYQKVRHFEETSQDFSFEAKHCSLSDKREIYVLVIGEASRACDWQLYGYERATNPELSRMEGLVTFRNMLTQSNTTHKSVPMILSSTPTEQHEELYRRKGLPALFKEAGFKTWFISNQSAQGAMIDKLAADSDSLLYISGSRYDCQMLDSMKRIIATDHTNNLLFILHCYGSHFSYHQRYPRDFARFQPDDDVPITDKNRTFILNSYDNSIVYTDHFLAQTIGYLRSLNACSALLYTSDHGEDILDDARDRFLHASPTTTFYQLYIASVAWFSPDYTQQFPEKVICAQTNSFAPATTRSIFHTLADIASIESPYLDTDISLVNRAFDYRRPRYYLNDHNQAKPFIKTGLDNNDLINFKRRGIIL
ncbi:MAG: lipid A phosphoethanolamine transferase [Alistipes sp.]